RSFSFVFFLFQRYLHFRVLHSFPTRRSSDLTVELAQRVLVVDDSHDSALTMSMLLKSKGAEVEVAMDGEQALSLFAEFKPATVRSEEHTSELQSQSNLVCRLLLEKKKQKKIS